MTMPDFSQCSALVVDDDEFARELVENVLLGIGCADVVTAFDRDSTVAAVQAHRPDFIFLDIYMPHVDGWALFDEVRRLHPDGAVIMITGSNLPTDFGKSMDKHVDGYCIKPVLPDVMRKVMSNALERKHA